MRCVICPCLLSNTFWKNDYFSVLSSFFLPFRPCGSIHFYPNRHKMPVCKQQLCTKSPTLSSQVSFCRVLLFPVDEEGLRRKITEELYKDMEKDRAKAEEELQAWLDAHKNTHQHALFGFLLLNFLFIYLLYFFSWHFVIRVVMFPLCCGSSQFKM